MTDEAPFIELMERFVAGRIGPRSFTKRFCEMWSAHVDECESRASDWDKRHGMELVALFRAGVLSQGEFAGRWSELWGHTGQERFLDMIGAVHTACHCWRPRPVEAHEIDAERLRSEVEVHLAEYRRQREPSSETG